MIASTHCFKDPAVQHKQYAATYVAVSSCIDRGDRGFEETWRQRCSDRDSLLPTSMLLAVLASAGRVGSMPRTGEAVVCWSGMCDGCLTLLLLRNVIACEH